MAASWSAIVNIATPMFETVAGDCIGLVMFVNTGNSDYLVANCQDFVAAADEAVAARGHASLGPRR
ncbi:MAG TPA: hypothetical protein VEF89_31050 [Solirubrobacteraceae bacterium]|nr:hypothetical protein [Solirubrobacteraceae bacterium]